MAGLKGTFTTDGNMVSKTENGQTTTYVYNYEDKMVQVNLPNGTSIVYSYDHSGKRIAKTAGGTTIDYYFDGDDLIIEAQGSSILAYYTQGQGLISQRRNNASYFYHYDGLGSTKVLTDANQNIQSTTIYDAWGNILQASGAITNPYLYVGELGYYGDGDVGMYLLTQRWYNPTIGRFVVKDPLIKGISGKTFQGQGLLPHSSLYLYVANSPANEVDPYGLVNPVLTDCLNQYWVCIRKVENEYEECKRCVEKAKDWCNRWGAIGWGGGCGLICVPFGGVGMVICWMACGGVGFELSRWGCEVIPMRMCEHDRLRGQEMCHNAFMMCRNRYRSPNHYFLQPIFDKYW
ncbi:RHS repeat-associated core domain-containing protein [bacterium]|nr:RHS repeat-associated core domain-containing protein [bacterium]